MAVALSQNLIKAEYKAKLMTADEAVKTVKSGDWIQYGEFSMQPKELDAALARRVNELEDVKIRCITMTMIPEVVKVDPERTPKSFKSESAIIAPTTLGIAPLFGKGRKN